MTQTKIPVPIMHWSCRGLVRNIDDIQKLTDKYEPHVVALQETNLTKNVKILHIFHILRKDRRLHPCFKGCHFGCGTWHNSEVNTTQHYTEGYSSTSLRQRARHFHFCHHPIMCHYRNLMTLLSNFLHHELWETLIHVTACGEVTKSTAGEN